MPRKPHQTIDLNELKYIIYLICAMCHEHKNIIYRCYIKIDR
jgi:hypothetical protein